MIKTSLIRLGIANEILIILKRFIYFRTQQLQLQVFLVDTKDNDNFQISHHQHESQTRFVSMTHDVLNGVVNCLAYLYYRK